MNRMNMGGGRAPSMDEDDVGPQMAQIKAKMMSTGGSIEDSISPASNQKQALPMGRGGKQVMQQPINVDDQVIPALNQQQKSMPQEYENDEGEEDKDGAEALTGESLAKA